MAGNIEIVLIAMVTAAAFSDLRNRQIPNWITISGAVTGLGLQTLNGGIHGALTSLEGAALGFGMFIVLYLARGMGAGDVKLLSAVGALVGPQAVTFVFVFTGLLGGIVAVAALIISAAPDKVRLPYGAVIAGGTFASLVLFH